MRHIKPKRIVAERLPPEGGIPCHDPAVTNLVDMRSLTPDARYERRTEVVRLKKTGLTYLQIGAQTELLRLREEYPRVTARAVIEDAEVNRGNDAPLRGLADRAESVGSGATDVDNQLGLTGGGSFQAGLTRRYLSQAHGGVARGGSKRSRCRPLCRDSCCRTSEPRPRHAR